MTGTDTGTGTDAGAVTGAVADAGAGAVADAGAVTVETDSEERHIRARRRVRATLHRVDDETWVTCPYCHESQLLVVDPDTEGTFVQDCDICCRPWHVHVERDQDGTLDVSVSRAQ